MALRIPRKSYVIRCQGEPGRSRLLRGTLASSSSKCPRKTVLAASEQSANLISRWHSAPAWRRKEDKGEECQRPAGRFTADLDGIGGAGDPSVFHSPAKSVRNGEAGKPSAFDRLTTG